MKNKELTRREIVAIYALCAARALGDKMNLYEVFQFATNSSASNDSLKTISAKWAKDPAVAGMIEKVTAKLELLKITLSDNSGEKDKKDDNLRGVDFADKDAFINYVTEKANHITDEKQRLDYLKILADIQRFKESKTDEQGEIQRFYTPQKCSSCPLYNDKSK